MKDLKITYYSNFGKIINCSNGIIVNQSGPVNYIYKLVNNRITGFDIKKIYDSKIITY